MNDNIDQDFPSLESRIRAARAERSIAIAYAAVEAGAVIGRVLRRLARALGRGLQAERDRRAIEADVFLKRSVPRY